MQHLTLPMWDILGRAAAFHGCQSGAECLCACVCVCGAAVDVPCESGILAALAFEAGGGGVPVRVTTPEAPDNIVHAH